MMMVSEVNKEELLNNVRQMKDNFPDFYILILHFDFEGWCTRFTNDNVRPIAIKIDEIYDVKSYQYAQDVFEKAEYVFINSEKLVYWKG